MREEGFSIRAIAKQLGRSPNAISYELRRNQVSRAYDPEKADRKAYQRRKDAKYQGMKVSGHTNLRRYVELISTMTFPPRPLRDGSRSMKNTCLRYQKTASADTLRAHTAVRSHGIGSYKERRENGGGNESK